MTWEVPQCYDDEGLNEGPTKAQMTADPGDARLTPHSSDAAGWQVSVDTQDESALSLISVGDALPLPHSPDVAGWQVGGDTEVDMGPEPKSVCTDKRRWKIATTMTQRLWSKNSSGPTFRPCHCVIERPEVRDVGKSRASPEIRPNGPSRMNIDNRCALATCAYEPSRETIWDDDWDGEVEMIENDDDELIEWVKGHGGQAPCVAACSGCKNLSAELNSGSRGGRSTPDFTFAHAADFEAHWVSKFPGVRPTQKRPESDDIEYETVYDDNFIQAIGSSGVGRPVTEDDSPSDEKQQDAMRPLTNSKPVSDTIRFEDTSAVIQHHPYLPGGLNPFIRANQPLIEFDCRLLQ